MSLSGREAARVGLAVKKQKNLKVGPNSCHGDYACQLIASGFIKEESCHGFDSCFDSKNLEVGPEACLEWDSCNGVENVIVKEKSCKGIHSCKGANNFEAAPDSCHGGRASCYNAEKTFVNEDSCHGEQSCYGLNNAEVGSGSCKGDFSCFGASYVSIGNDSCRCVAPLGSPDYGCCANCRGYVPDGACNTNEIGEPENADDFLADGTCRYCSPE